MCEIYRDEMASIVDLGQTDHMISLILWHTGCSLNIEDKKDKTKYHNATLLLADLNSNATHLYIHYNDVLFVVFCSCILCTIFTLNILNTWLPTISILIQKMIFYKQASDWIGIKVLTLIRLLI